MKRVLLTLMMMTLVAGLGTSLQAHHSLAPYDQTTLIPVKGVVTKVDWLNPHAWITLTVTNTDGKTFTQRIEISGVGALTKRGIEKTMLTIGETVTLRHGCRRTQKLRCYPMAVT
jgi:hypothetical protein